MVLRQLPSAGVRISIVSRFDSDVIPSEYTDVCQEVIVNVDDQSLDFKLFNRTGEGESGYHYDPITVLWNAGNLNRNSTLNGGLF